MGTAQTLKAVHLRKWQRESLAARWDHTESCFLGAGPPQVRSLSRTVEVWRRRRLCDVTADCDPWEPLTSLAALLGTWHRGHADHWRGAVPVGIWDVSPFLVTEVNVETPGSRQAELCKRLTLSTMRQGPPPRVGLGMEFF